MHEQILQDGETIELQQENCTYCGDGAMAMVRTGDAILTNRRLLICENKQAIQVIIICAIIAAVVVIILPIAFGVRLGAIGGAIVGGIIGGTVWMVFSRFKKPNKTTSDSKIALSFSLNDIAHVEDGKRGLNTNMLKLTTTSGDICKIGVTHKEQWRAALLKHKA